MGMRNLTFLAAAIGVLVLSGCGGLMGASRHMAGGSSYVRAHRGEGTRQTLTGDRDDIYQVFLKYLQKSNTYSITQEPGAIYGKASAVDLAVAVYFDETKADGTIDVEVLMASPWLRGKQLKNGEQLMFNEVVERIELAAFKRTGVRPAVLAPAAPRRAARKSPRIVSDVDKLKRALAAERPNDFALVIGIEEYQNIPKASFGKRDAESVREYVQGLGVPEENIIFLTGPLATRTGITKYLQEWLPRNVEKDSRVYFYYSGHGAPDPKSGSAYLVPWDGDPTFLKSTAYSVRDIFRDLEKLKAKEVIVMLDACFSGAGGRSVIAKGVRPLVNVKDYKTKKKSRISVLSASALDEIAGSMEKEGHGIFTYYMLKGLQGAADADKDNHVTLQEMHDYTLRKVRRKARRQNREQTPQLQTRNAGLRLY